MANGTAPQCGRVGSRHILFKPFINNDEGFFYAPILKEEMLAGPSYVPKLPLPPAPPSFMIIPCIPLPLLAPLLPESHTSCAPSDAYDTGHYGCFHARKLDSMLEYTDLTLQEARKLAILVYDMSGRHVYGSELKTFSPGSHQILLPLQGLSAGQYVYRLNGAAGTVLATGVLTRQ